MRGDGRRLGGQLRGGLSARRRVRRRREGDHQHDRQHHRDHLRRGQGGLRAQGLRLFAGGLRGGLSRDVYKRQVLLGGLDDRAGVLVDGPKEAIEQEVYSVLDRMGTTGFLLGADCTLPTEIPYAHIRTAVEATGKYASR